jgi:molecular chaperone GrpE
MTKKTAPIPPVDPRDQEIATLREKVARAIADYHNLEARYSRESGNMIKFGNASLLEKLLEVRDHLGLAASAGDKSLELILSSFDNLLSSEGVTTIPTSGAFDPTLMECQEQVPGDEGMVVNTTRLGYKLHDRVLRPARVTVGSGSSSNSN